MLHVIHEIHDDPHGGSWDINGKNAIPAKPSNLSLSLSAKIHQTTAESSKWHQNHHPRLMQSGPSQHLEPVAGEATSGGGNMPLAWLYLVSNQDTHN